MGREKQLGISWGPVPVLSYISPAKHKVLPAHPASFVHNFVSGMQSFHFSETQDAMVLQIYHEK